MPHITFIIPVYNVPDKMLAECLQHLFDMQLPPVSEFSKTAVCEYVSRHLW